MKNYTAIFLMMILGLFTTGQARGGDAPANDNFAGAATLVVENGTANIATTNFEATKQQGEPNHAENAGGKSVWFKYTPAVTKIYRIGTFDITFDTLLAVYTGDSVGNLQSVGYNDDCNIQCGGASTVDLTLAAGTTYYIAVDGFNDNGTIGVGNFRITLLESDTPFNDNMSSAYNLGTSHRGSIAGTNSFGTREANEPDHINSNSPGVKSVWYRWQSNGTGGTAIELTEGFNSQITVYKSPVATPTFAQLTRVQWNGDYLSDSVYKYRVKFLAEQGVIYFFVIGGHSQFPQFGDNGNYQMRFRPFKMSYSTDFNANDEKASIGVYRPSEGNWYSHTSIGNLSGSVFKWGANGDVPFAADFDGDGDSEHAVARSQNGQKVWYIRTTPAPTIITWGLASDKPLVGDFDGDSRADLVALRNTANGYIWYVRQSSNGAMRTFNFGTTGDTPILGDFDGDRRTDVAVVRNTQNGFIWYILESDGGSNADYTYWTARQFGIAPDVAAVEDFDGDEKTDIAVFRPSNGTWYILQSSNGQVRIDNFGLSGDKPQPADYNGDGKADLAVFRPSTGTWYIAEPTGIPAQNFHAIQWGAANDIPVSSFSTLSQ